MARLEGLRTRKTAILAIAAEKTGPGKPLTASAGGEEGLGYPRIWSVSLAARIRPVVRGTSPRPRFSPSPGAYSGSPCPLAISPEGGASRTGSRHSLTATGHRGSARRLATGTSGSARRPGPAAAVPTPCATGAVSALRAPAQLVRDLPVIGGEARVVGRQLVHTLLQLLDLL